MIIPLERYEQMMQQFRANKRPEAAYWPTEEQIKRVFYPDPDRWLWYVCYLLETNPPPANNRERIVRKRMVQFRNQNIELAEEEIADAT